MKKHPRLTLISLILLLACLLWLMSACNLAPRRSYAPTSVVVGFVLPTTVPTSTPTPRPSPTALSREANCTSYLSYVNDKTIPDGTVVRPGEVVDKQWTVKNTGSCNWGPGYTLRVTENRNSVAVKDQAALYPALKDSEVIIRVVFTAPEDEGEYFVEWFPFDASGTRFHEHLTVEFLVRSSPE